VDAGDDALRRQKVVLIADSFDDFLVMAFGPVCCDTTPGRAIFGIVTFGLEGFAALPARYPD